MLWSTLQALPRYKVIYSVLSVPWWAFVSNKQNKRNKTAKLPLELLYQLSTSPQMKQWQSNQLLSWYYFDFRWNFPNIKRNNLCNTALIGVYVPPAILVLTNSFPTIFFFSPSFSMLIYRTDTYTGSPPLGDGFVFNWSERSACAALGCRQKRRWLL